MNLRQITTLFRQDLANAMREYRLDSFDHIPREKCTVGALRAQSPDVDVSVD